MGGRMGRRGGEEGRKGGGKKGRRGGEEGRRGEGEEGRKGGGEEGRRRGGGARGRRGGVPLIGPLRTHSSRTNLTYNQEVLSKSRQPQRRAEGCQESLSRNQKGFI